jgi:hypothetical protein
MRNNFYDDHSDENDGDNDNYKCIVTKLMWLRSQVVHVNWI